MKKMIEKLLFKNRSALRLRVSVAALTLAAVASGVLVNRPAHAQEGQGEGNGLVGSWRVTVNVTNPPGFPSFPVMMTFHADGTLLQSRIGYYFPKGRPAR